MIRYPRDLHGHGEAPPDPDWPEGARIALQVVIDHEEGGESDILHGDAASEAFLPEIVGAADEAKAACSEFDAPDSARFGFPCIIAEARARVDRTAELLSS